MSTSDPTQPDLQHDLRHVRAETDINQLWAMLGQVISVVSATAEQQKTTAQTIDRLATAQAQTERSITAMAAAQKALADRLDAFISVVERHVSDDTRHR